MSNVVTLESTFLSIEEVAERLRADVPWVREKVRRRSPNPMPCLNLGRHLVFEWDKVLEWARNSQRPRHAAHRPRTKVEVAKVVKARKKAA